MPSLAMNIQMQGKLVVIIGGGKVASRKIRTILDSGASIRLVAISIVPEIEALKAHPAVELRVARYSAADLDGAFLVVAATDDPLINIQISEDAAKFGILVSVADNPAIGNCTFPAVLKRGNLEIAVSTGGRSPLFAVEVRNRVAKIVSERYGEILEILANEREKLLTNRNSKTYNADTLRLLTEKILNENLID